MQQNHLPELREKYDKEILPDWQKKHDAWQAEVGKSYNEAVAQWIISDSDGKANVLAVQSWVAAGKLKVQEDIIDGLENTPKALIGLLAGENRGKRMIRV